MKVGLINCTSDLEVPLREIQNQVSIKGFVSSVHSTLVYQNNESNPIEAKFVFPMHDQSCVYKFEAEIEGRHIVAEIQDKTQAKETYDDAIASGQTAMMMSEDDQSGDIFEVKIGNLPANTEAKLTLGYVRELTVESDGTVIFTLPTQLNPRYTPAGSPPTLDSQVPYVSTSSIPYTMTFTAKIESHFIIEQVDSKTEKLKVEKSEDSKTAMVELAESYKFDHDLSLEVKYQSSDGPQVILEQKLPDGVGLLKEDVLMLNYFPEFKDETKVKGEYVFIIDRSGSMGGDRIQKAKETLLLLIKSLPQDCMFNIIGFGSNFESLFNKSKIYNEENLKKAKKHQKSIEANLGGTEILQPLKHVYSVGVQPTYARQVFLLTDGDVSNTSEVIALVKKNAHTTRVFTFGIGSGVSTTLVDGVARVSGGRATYVSDNDRLQSKVISALKCSMEPSITDIELEWNLPKDVTATNIPSQLPIVVKGEKLIIYAIIQGHTEQSKNTKGSLKLKGKIEGKNIEHTQTFDLSSASIKDELAPLHRLAAKSQIKELEYDINLLENRYYENQPFEEKKKEIILVSTAASVVSKYTAFVGIDKERGQPVQGEMQTRYVPEAEEEEGHWYRCSIDMCSSSLSSCGLSGDGGFNLKSYSSCSLKNSFSDTKKSKGFGGFRFPSFGLFKRKKKKAAAATRGHLQYCDAAMGFSPQVDCSESLDFLDEEKSNESKLMELIDLQAFDGSWILTRQLASIFEKTVEEIQKNNPINNELVWTTVLAVTWLRLEQPSKQDEWQLIERKALDWVARQDLKGKSTDEILELASTFLSGPTH